MKKQIISALALVAIMLPIASASDNREVYFTDLEVEDPQYNQIQWLARSGILQGYPDGTFRSGTCINRAEFLKVLYLTTQSGLDDAGTNPFPDVDQDQWYYPYVMSAYNDGIVSGYGDGTFQPENCVTKPEVLKMASEAYYTDQEINVVTQAQQFPNGITQNAWFFKYFNFALPKNIVVYDPEFTVNQPLSFQGATRGDVAETLWRFQSLQDSGVLVYNTSTTAPKEIFQEYFGIDEMLTFHYPANWEITEEYFYETAGGVTSEMATIILQHQMMPSDQISINQRMVMCGDTDDTATCLETEIGYTISSFNPSQATLKAMQKIQSTLTYEPADFFENYIFEELGLSENNSSTNDALELLLNQVYLNADLNISNGYEITNIDNERDILILENEKGEDIFMVFEEYYPGSDNLIDLIIYERESSLYKRLATFKSTYKDPNNTIQYVIDYEYVNDQSLTSTFLIELEGGVLVIDYDTSQHSDVLTLVQPIIEKLTQ